MEVCYRHRADPGRRVQQRRPSLRRRLPGNHPRSRATITRGSRASLNIEFANTSSFDQVFIKWHAYLNGALNLQLDSTSTPRRGSNFLI